MTTPQEQGYAMPADHGRHARTWIAWPCREAVGAERLAAAREVVADLVHAIAEFESVTIVARPDLVAPASLACGPGVPVLPLSLDDARLRDVGPSFVEGPDGTQAGIAWRFNGWGGRRDEHAQDALVARRLLDHLGLPCIAGRIVLEGGAIAQDGEGTALLCTASVLESGRNPGADAAEIEAVLRDLLGIRRVVWLPHGLAGDPAGGQVGLVARFARPGHVLVHAPEDESDPDFAGCAANLERLGSAVDAAGRTLELTRLPSPRQRQGGDAAAPALSYLDFALCQGGIVAPGFRASADQAAMKLLAAAFAERRLVQVEALDLAAIGAGLHAVTLPQPETVLPATLD